jgi:dihydroflavonol-4-reductase
MRTAFVTGATGLLGTNLIRALVDRGVQVRALARSKEKAQAQLGGLVGVEVVVGDMAAVDAFKPALSGSDVLFHTAAYFREAYGGGNHTRALHDTNITGTRALIDAAYAVGVRRMVHVSSIAVLDGQRGATLDETNLRDRKNADPYYLSKIDTDEVLFAALRQHSDFSACMVLPGWMHGPGDAGPTSAGQFTLDYMNRKLPGATPGTFSVVDARDVANAAVVAAEKGRRGERYLAAGRHMGMRELMGVYERVTGVKAPTRSIPGAALMAIAGLAELGGKISGKPVLISRSTVKLMLREAERTRFNHAKSELELGLTFRPVEDTIRDEVAWFTANGFLSPCAKAA